MVFFFQQSTELRILCSYFQVCVGTYMVLCKLFFLGEPGYLESLTPWRRNKLFVYDIMNPLLHDNTLANIGFLTLNFGKKKEFITFEIPLLFNQFH